MARLVLGLKIYDCRFWPTDMAKISILPTQLMFKFQKFPSRIFWYFFKPDICAIYWIYIHVTFQMSGKRTRSFKCAVHQRDREVCSENDFQLVLSEPPLFRKMVHAVAVEVLPEERDRKYYADRYTCCPPPLFIILITILEVRAGRRFLTVSICMLYILFPSLAGLLCVSHCGDGRDDCRNRTRTQWLHVHLSSGQAPWDLEICSVYGTARWLVPSGFQCGCAAALWSATGDGARLDAHRLHLFLWRSCRFPRHQHLWSRGVSGGRQWRCLCSASGASGQRAAQLPPDALWRGATGVYTDFR